jgi:Xaa-Pro dipeptidase
VEGKEDLSEIDIAMFIESETRQLGAEGMGFPLIAAGPERSFAIHAFPNYSNSPFAAKGMSILDFGVLYEGYTTDVTCTVCSGPLTEKQKNMIQTVEEAYTLGAELLKPEASTKEIAAEVESFLKERGYDMPHSLGHGIGLAAHENPVLRNREDSDTALKPGMVVTIEPGLYDPESGGVRLENDYLVTPSGAEALTRSRIYTLA